MARLPAPIETTSAYEFYKRWCAYSAQADVVPDPWVFWREVFVKLEGYFMPRSTFEYGLRRLQMGRMPLVWRDDATGAWRLRDLDIAER